MDVRELGPVTNPAYPTTDAALRSIEICLGISLDIEVESETEELAEIAAGVDSDAEPDSEEIQAARSLVRALFN
jgi:hypothetical protein